MHEEEPISQVVRAVHDSVEAVPDALKKDAAIVAMEAVPDEAKQEVVTGVAQDASSAVKREMAAAAVRMLSREEQEQVVETLAEGLGCDRGWKRFLEETDTGVVYEAGDGERVVLASDAMRVGDDDPSSVNSARSAEAGDEVAVDAETAALRAETDQALERAGQGIERLRALKF